MQLLSRAIRNYKYKKLADAQRKSQKKETVAEVKNVGRMRHPKEVPYIKPSEYGVIKFEFNDKNAVGFVDEKGTPMRILDQYEHMIVFGGSGTGKTYSILQPLWEEWFRSTHLPDEGKHSIILDPSRPPIQATREDVKFGALVIEAKGDFKDKTWSMAQKYGRMDDCVYFGPTHRNVVYNMFGDPTESPLQKSNKMVAILKAFSDGKSGQDPFWDNAARKLFLNIFIMHDMLSAAYRETGDSAYKVTPMSFQLMNLLLMDRGIPRNQGEISAFQEEYSREYTAFIECCKELVSYCEPLRAEVSYWQKHLDLLNATPESEESKKNIPTIKEFLDEGQLIETVETALKKATAMLNVNDDMMRRHVFNATKEPFQRLFDEARKAVVISRHIEENYSKMGNAKGLVNSLIRLTANAIQIHEKVNSLLERPRIEPAMGALKIMVTQYEKLIEAQKKEAQLDPLWAYFNEEYLSMANEKTSGSIAMVASNMVAMFVHPPFSEIFSPEANFNFNQVIDEGKIVYLDMPTALYGAAATVASLALKIDFFRCMLSRPRLYKRNPDGTMSDKIVNQIRPMSYFCDEFASVVSTGDETGEAGFMDKVREFKCACLLGTQSIPMLLKKLQDNEVDAILTNTAVKIFLRNTDPKTNEYAGKILGSEIKVTSNLTMGAMETYLGDSGKLDNRGFNTSYQKQAKFDQGDFSKLQKGQAIVCLNPRFGRNQIQKLSFKGRPVPPSDQTPPYNIKHTHNF